MKDLNAFRGFKLRASPVIWSLLAIALIPVGLRAEPPLLQMVEPGRALPALAFYRDQPATWKVAGFFSTGASSAITADLNLIANGVAAPYQKSLPVFAAIQEAKETGALTEITLKLPKVEKATQFGLVFRQADQPIAFQSLEVVPEVPGDYFRALLAGASTSSGLAVFGTTETLRKFFDATKVSYQDLGSESPASVQAWLDSLNRKGGSYSGLILNTEGRAPVTLLFATDPRKPPGVYVRGPTALITLPITDQLGTDPRTERLLVETLEMLINQP